MDLPSYVDSSEGRMASEILNRKYGQDGATPPSLLPTLYTSLWESIVAEPRPISYAMLFSNSVTLETHCNMLQSQTQAHVVDGETISFESLIGEQQDNIFLPGMLAQQDLGTVVIKYPKSLSGLQHRALLEVLVAGHYTGLESISTINPPNVILMFESDSIKQIVGEAMNDHGCASLISAADLISPASHQAKDSVSIDGLAHAVDACESTQPVQSVSIPQHIQAEIKTYAEKFYSHPSWADCQVLNSSVRTVEDTVNSLEILTKAIARELGNTTISGKPHLLFADDLLRLTYSGLTNQQVCQNEKQIFDWCTDMDTVS